MPRFKALVLIFFASYGVCSAEICGANSRYIYTISVDLPLNRHARLTGFQLDGLSGIVTSLHGVLDGKNMTAFSADVNANLITDLDIAAVDVRNDIALLRPNGSQLPSAGIPSSKEEVSPSQPLTACGHPEGNPLYNRSLITNPVPIIRLSSFIVQRAKEFEQRASPAPDIDVISLSSTLVPGESGAPILDSNGVLRGIADGGLARGADQISWGIPYRQVQLSRVTDAQYRLTAIKALGTSDVLFAYDNAVQGPGNTITVSSGRDGQYTSLEKALFKVHNGGTILVLPGTYTLGGALIVDKTISIIGAGKNRDEVVIRGGIRFEKDAQIELKKLTLIGALSVSGKAEIADVAIASHEAVVLEEGSITHISYSDIAAREPGYAYHDYSAIFGHGSTILKVENTTISSEGDAVFLYGGRATFDNCIMSAEKYAFHAVGTDIILNNSDLTRVQGDGYQTVHLYLLSEGARVHGSGNRK